MDSSTSLSVTVYAYTFGKRGTLDMAIYWWLCTAASTARHVHTSLWSSSQRHKTKVVMGGLWSSSTTDLIIPRVRHATIGGRAFAFAASATLAWNSISDSTRSAPSLNTFDTHLKTELFQWSFKVWRADVPWPQSNFTHFTLMNIHWPTFLLDSSETDWRPVLPARRFCYFFVLTLLLLLLLPEPVHWRRLPPNPPTAGRGKRDISRCKRAPERVLLVVKGRIGWRKGWIRLERAM